MELIQLVQLHIIWKWVHPLQWKQQPKECKQQGGSVFDKFGIMTPCSATYNLEVGAPVSVKAAIIASLKVKKKTENLDFQATFLKQKQRSATIKMEWL